jgi:hypothetical protein
VSRLRPLAWLGAVAVVVLGARAVAYALQPSPLASTLAHRAGGPALPVVALVAAALALALASVIVWLAALGVRERRQLERRPLVTEPRLRLGSVVVRATSLWLSASLGFALVESYLHWRAGLGWHGLHCLTGPVHRDAIPLLGALSLVGAALSVAVDHVLAWIHRTLAEIDRSRVPRPAAIGILAGLTGAVASSVWRGTGLGARAPPLPSA